MKFDKLCGIILSEAKADAFANLVLGNQNPTFAKEDILRDPADPSKGTMMYLSGKDEKRRGWEAGNEQSIRRQLRRLNWVARNVIKKMAGKTDGISIEKVHELIQSLLERYQTVVLGQKVDKANTGYETRVIGNILLPPTKRNPHGKSILIVPGMDPNATPADAAKPIRAARKERRTGAVIKLAPVTADEVYRKWEDISDFFEQLLDTDLIATIRDIIETGVAEKPEPVSPEQPVEAPAPEAAVPAVGEAVEDEPFDPTKEKAPENPDDDEIGMTSGVEDPDVGIQHGATLRDILNDPRIKGVFDPRAVKLAVKGMMKGGEIEQDESGYLVMTGGRVAGSKLGTGGAAEIEAEPEELELTAAKFGEEMPTDVDLKKIEDEENIEPEIPVEKPTWYPADEKEEGEEAEELPAEEEEEKEKSSDDWWK